MFHKHILPAIYSNPRLFLFFPNYEGSKVSFPGFLGPEAKESLNRSLQEVSQLLKSVAPLPCGLCKSRLPHPWRALQLGQRIMFVVHIWPSSGFILSDSFHLFTIQKKKKKLTSS